MKWLEQRHDPDSTPCHRAVGTMRHFIRSILDLVFVHPPGRWMVLGLDVLVRRLMWLWGHLRFAALVRHRGERCVCHWNAEIKYPDRLKLGNRVIIGTNAVLGAAGGITLDDDVRLSRDVILETAGLDFKGKPAPYNHVFAPIHLESGVWVGARAIILAGVTIGKNSVVAAGAVVSKDVPAGSVAAGIPAKIVGVSGE